MKISTGFLKIFLAVAICLSAYSVEAQTTREFTVMLRADISKAPDITLIWEKDVNALSYNVMRRVKIGSTWISIGKPAGNDTSFTDTTTVKGIAYEYQVLKTARLGTEIYFASGYIYAGSEVYPVQEERRKVLLVVDETFKTSLAAEITQLENDLNKESWEVAVSYAARADTFYAPGVMAVKKIIADEYAKDPKLLKSVVLIGRIPVPYSGEIVPDGHRPDHHGAWPADGYYGDMDESLWTDTDVENTGASRRENKNIPGDGKFDQSNFPAPLQLAVGRIDLSDMSNFTKTELELLKGYFDRNHDFRTGKLNIPQRGIVDDNFGSMKNPSVNNGDTTRYPESFSSTAWRSWSPLIGAENIEAGDFFSTLNSSAYLWAYGCGPGGSDHRSVGGVGITQDFANNPVNTIFSALFGSYSGDWDINNAILRAPLASSPGALTSVWAGRPHWFFHRMGLGETIGQSTLLSQNNYYLNNGKNYLSTSYFSTKFYPNGTWYSGNSQTTHIALMGDPTLVMQPMERNVNFTSILITADTNRASLIWGATPDTDISGYFVYRSKDASGPFVRLNNEAIMAVSYIDTTTPGGVNFYKIVASKLQTSPSGSYFTPLVTSAVMEISVISSIAEETTSFKNISIQPNPANEIAEISFKNTGFEKVDIEILDVAGRSVMKLFSGVLEGNDNSFQWDLLDETGTRVPSGIYLVKITSGKHTTTQKIVVMP